MRTEPTRKKSRKQVKSANDHQTDGRSSTAKLISTWLARAPLPCLLALPQPPTCNSADEKLVVEGEERGREQEKKMFQQMGRQFSAHFSKSASTASSFSPEPSNFFEQRERRDAGRASLKISIS